jgi:hypothetical protein
MHGGRHIPYGACSARCCCRPVAVPDKSCGIFYATGTTTLAAFTATRIACD